jgi:DNA primase
MDYNDIKDTIRVEEVEDALGIKVVSRSGKEHTAHCPLPSHIGSDRNPSFGINVDLRVYNCFGCGDGGNLLRLVVAILGCSNDEALTFLAQYSDFVEEDETETFINQLDKWQNRKPERITRDEELPILNEGSIIPFVGQELVYFRQRGISDTVSHQQRLGYDYRRQRGSHCSAAAIIPVYFRGYLVGFQERWIDHGKVDFPDWIPKYTNSKEFPKKQILYNYDNARGRGLDGSEPTIVVESALSACTLMSYGYNAISTFSASLSDQQIKLLREFAWIEIGFDNDKAGKEALKKSVKALADHTMVNILNVPEGKDLGDMTEDEVASVIENSVPTYML